MPTIGRLSLWLFFFYIYFIFLIKLNSTRGEPSLSLFFFARFPPFSCGCGSSEVGANPNNIMSVQFFPSPSFSALPFAIAHISFSRPTRNKEQSVGILSKGILFFFFVFSVLPCRCQTHWTRPQAARPALLPCLVRGGGGKSSSLSLSRFPKRKNLLRSYYLRTTRRNERKSEEFSLPFFSPFFFVSLPSASSTS